MKWTLLFLLIPTLHAGWIIDQKGYSGPERWAIGDSVVKFSYAKGYKELDFDLILDFAGGTVTQVDHAHKTIAKAKLDEYIARQAAASRANDYRPEGASGNYGGLPCTKYSYTYNGGGVGNWGGGSGCYTTAVKLTAAYQPKFERWLMAFHATKSYLGLNLWYSAAHDGPSRVVLETVRSVNGPVAASEFKTPAGYTSADFDWPR